MENKQLIEKQGNGYNPFFPIVRLEDIIETITDKSIQWIFNNYNHIYVEYSESREITRNKVPQLLRRSGLWISYNNGKDNITEHYIGENTDVNNYVEWTSDDNWKKFDELTIQDKSITYQHLSDALRQLVAGGNTITNFPDEEDITSDGTVLSFKDRDYDPNTFSGLGRVILRKNLKVVDGQVKNILTQRMINKENTIYEIRYNFDLNGEEITIPEGCVLDFQGGSLSNGDINCNNCIIKNFVYGHNIHLLNNTYKVFKASDFISVTEINNGKYNLSLIWDAFISTINSNWNNLKCTFVVDFQDVFITKPIELVRGISLISYCNTTIWDTPENNTPYIINIDNPALDKTLCPNDPIVNFIDKISECVISNFQFDTTANTDEELELSREKTVIFDNMGSHNIEYIRIPNLNKFGWALKQAKCRGGSDVRSYADRQYIRQFNCNGGYKKYPIVLYYGDGRIIENSILPSMLLIGFDGCINSVIASDVTILYGKVTFNNFHSENTKINIIGANIMMNNCILGSNYAGWRSSDIDKSTIRIGHKDIIDSTVEYMTNWGAYPGSNHSSVILNGCVFAPKFSNVEKFDIDVEDSSVCDLNYTNCRKLVPYSQGTDGYNISVDDIKTNYNKHIYYTLKDKNINISVKAFHRDLYMRDANNKNRNPWVELGTYKITVTYFPIKDRPIYKRLGEIEFNINDVKDNSNVLSIGLEKNKNGIILIQLNTPSGKLFNYEFQKGFNNRSVGISNNSSVWNYNPLNIPFNYYSINGNEWLESKEYINCFSKKSVFITYNTCFLLSNGFTDRMIESNNIESIDNNNNNITITLIESYNKNSHGELMLFCNNDIIKQKNKKGYSQFLTDEGDILIGSNNNISPNNRAKYLLNATNSIQIDAYGAGQLLKLQTTNSEITSKRPVNAIRGEIFFDTAINKPIWWTGTKWVDATGANV